MVQTNGFIYRETAMKVKAAENAMMLETSLATQRTQLESEAAVLLASRLTQQRTELEAMMESSIIQEKEKAESERYLYFALQY